jgi:ABC-type lipoprotein export system ATPase subunit
VLRDLYFQPLVKEISAIHGPSGSGKTTLFRILAKLTAPTSGEVTYKGRAITTLNRHEAQFYRQQIGIIFQDFKLVENWTLAENISLPLKIKRESQKTIQSALAAISEELGISDVLSQYPAYVSGGQQQRAAAARALISNPEILLADEPTGNLDREHGRVILDLLRRTAQKNKTVIVATHDEQIINAPDVHSYRLKEGQIEK